MDEYTIYCTPEQTRKALELGAPIKVREFIGGELDDDWCYDINTNYACKIPTTEQMIGWLESEKLFSFDIRKRVITWSYFIYYNMRHFLQDPVIEDDGLDSRKEATIEAIDSALEYLKTLNNN